MSGCCTEYGCRRKTPIAIYLGDFSGRVYAATRTRLVSDHGDGTATLAATEKHDITPAVEKFIRREREWVLEVLEDKP